MKKLYDIGYKYSTEYQIIIKQSNTLICVFGCGIYATKNTKYTTAWKNVKDGTYAYPQKGKKNQTVAVSKTARDIIHRILNEKTKYLGIISKKELVSSLKMLKALFQNSEPFVCLENTKNALLFTANAVFDGNKGTIVINKQKSTSKLNESYQHIKAFYNILRLLAILTYLSGKITVNISDDQTLYLEDKFSTGILLPMSEPK